MQPSKSIAPQGLAAKIRTIAVAIAAAAAAWASAATPQAAGQGATAEPYVWANVRVGGGGFAPNIIFSGAEPGLAYLRTDMGGAYRWDQRQVRWIPLQDDNPVSSYMGIESLAADPRDANIVYLAAGMYYRERAAILRSADRGATWRATQVPFRMGGNEDGRGLGERLAIDPNRTATLFFGSRHDGLWRSDDSGTSWRKVDSFPHKGLGPPRSRKTHAGISFVLVDPKSADTRHAGSRRIYAAVADPALHHLYRSTDGGATWQPVPGEPPPDMLPVRADMDERGNLYIAYSTSIGPSNIEDGSVWRLDTRSGRWSDITPDRDSEGGYMGISVDRRRPGRLAVSSINRWRPGDTIWVSADDGRSWTDLGPISRRDTGATPFLNWGEREADFGHWTAGLAIDPFNSGTIAYTTGATLYRTDDGLKPSMLWRPWVRGIEQTAVITMISPTGGAHLISGFWDIAGFVHDRFDLSPPQMHLNPLLNNTNNLDYAGLEPNIVVRSGSRHDPERDGASLAWSADGGRTWRPLKAPPIEGRRHDTNGEAPINVSADGRTFVVGTPVVMATGDRGRTWFAPAGLPRGAGAIADKASPDLFYAVDFRTRSLFVSRNAARSFHPAAAAGLPRDFAPDRPRNREAQFPLRATPGRSGQLWFKLGGRLFRSDDFGTSFRRASGDDFMIEQFGLGRSDGNSDAPALFAIGTKGSIRGVWRSDDGGASWVRINDDRHQWGLRFRAISGDPRIYGRVYVATDGRGLFFGEPRR